MIFDRSRGVQYLTLVCQCVLVSLAYWLWLPLCHDLSVDRLVISNYLVYNEFILLGMLAAYLHLPPTSRHASRRFEQSSRQSLQQAGITLFILSVYLVAVHDGTISRRFFFSFVPVLYLVLFATNYYLPSWLGRLSFRRRSVEKVVLVGPKAKALAIKQWLDRHGSLGLETIGMLSETNEDVAGDPLPTLGTPNDLGKILGGPGLMMVIMAEFPRNNGSLRPYAELCEQRGVRLLVVADLDSLFGHGVSIFHDNGLVLIGLREEPLEDPVNRLLKRALDIAISLPVVLLILPPLTLGVWLLQRWQSPGPILFRQARDGFRNVPFNVLKFRTMHVASAGNELPPSTDSDPRVFPAGRFLRRTSIDEMPQFLNVLVNDMSIVGPRPHLMSDNERFHHFYLKAYVRSFVKPGITGLAQVRGLRGRAETAEAAVGRMQADIEYLENWSFGMDFLLILRTAAQLVVPPKTAL